MSIHRAGDVVGTPAWQLDLMNGQRISELRNEIIPEDNMDQCYVESCFREASYFLGQAVNKLCVAYEYADKFGKGQQIEELINKLDDDIPFEMSQLISKLKEVS
ncbi:MAG: hypothetical protein IIZ93_14140 [Acidaminococcaceae bacterium]|nr:hypothetical protein [Acidaminococcaceae bacterium]